ncbi:hypothetical protein Trydic_g5830 [Trypoxylus dichotomus]
MLGGIAKATLRRRCCCETFGWKCRDDKVRTERGKEGLLGGVRDYVFFIGQVELVMPVHHDDVAKWDGRPRRPKQCVDEADGDRPQGTSSSRLCTGFHGQDS